jgi:hypothetical protein
MSPRKDAEAFIKDQLNIMGKYGNAPKLSAKRYAEAVNETQKSLESLQRHPEKAEMAEKAKAKSASRK